MIRKMLAALALVLAVDTASALRVIEQVERAVELTLADLNLPAPGGSTISFSECETCGISTHRLVDTTVFRVNGQIVPLVDFLRIADEIAGKPNGEDNAVAVVFLDIATERITRIELRD